MVPTKIIRTFPVVSLGGQFFIKYSCDLGSEVQFCLGFTVRRLLGVNLKGSAGIAFLCSF